MWDRFGRYIIAQGLSLAFDIMFHSELESLDDDFLMRVAGDRALRINGRTEIFNGEHATILAWPLEPAQVKRSFNFKTRRNPGQFKKTLSGLYERDKYFASSSIAGRAACVYWQSDSPTAMQRKARYVLRQVAESIEQLPSGVPCGVHVGLDSLDGDLVEALRFARIAESLSEFDPGDRLLDWIYIHVFVPECPPDEVWAIDETVYTFERATRASERLKDTKLVLPPSVSLLDKPHWLRGNR
jgi:hypothetical protein